MRRISFGLLAVITLLVAGCTGIRPPASQPRPPARSLDLQGIIDQTRDGSVAVIPYGEYRLPKGLTIENRKELTLTCEPGTRVLVEDTNADVLSIRDSQAVRVENLYLRHVVPLEEYNCHGAVLRIRDSSEIHVTNCELNGCGAIGVFAQGCTTLCVRNCFIHHNTWCALALYDSEDIRIQSNVIQDNGLLMQTRDTGSLEAFDNATARNGGYVKGYPDPNPGLKRANPAP